jgi:hypothetical protein
VAEGTGLLNRGAKDTTGGTAEAYDEAQERLGPTLASDPELRKVVAAWPRLDERIRRAIVQLVRYPGA